MDKRLKQQLDFVLEIDEFILPIYERKVQRFFRMGIVTVPQICALAAQTVRKHNLEDKNPIGAADLKWIFACNYEGTEQLLEIQSKA